MIKKKIILDCDPGHDDAVAIMLAAASDKIEILGITCVAGNTTLENTKLNALKICSLIGKTDIPIFAGSNKPNNAELVVLVSVNMDNLNEFSKLTLSNVNILDKINIEITNERKTKKAILTSSSSIFASALYKFLSIILIGLTSL